MKHKNKSKIQCFLLTNLILPQILEVSISKRRRWFSNSFEGMTNIEKIELDIEVRLSCVLILMKVLDPSKSKGKF